MHEFKEYELNQREKEEIELIKQCNENFINTSDQLEDPFEKDSPVEDCFADYGDEVFAVLSIPKLEIQLPIYLGASEAQLSEGVGIVERSSLPTGQSGSHSLLAGHRGMATKEMFRHLDKLKEGDKFHIYFFDKKLTYRIFQTEVVQPWETDHLGIQEGRDLVTLFTCHPYPVNDKRLLKWGERVD